MPIKTVLIAGAEDSNNHYVRLCLQNFLKPTHMPWASNKAIPSLDAAIIVGTAVSHDLQWKVRDIYKGKPIFFANNGVSSIREEFETAVYGDGILKKLRSDDVSGVRKLAFVLGRFFSRGDSFAFKTFKEVFEHIIKSDANSVMTNAFVRWKERGVVESTGRGLYRFNGLTDRMYDDLLKHGLFLEKDSRLVPAGTTEILVPQQSVPEEIQVVSPPAPIEIPTPAPLPAMTAEAQSVLDLSLEAMAKMQSQMDAMQAKMNETLAAMERMEERLSGRLRKDMESTLNRHTRLYAIYPELRGMDEHGLQKFRDLFGFFKENFVGRQVVTPATPPQLS